jgi:NnrS protein
MITAVSKPCCDACGSNAPIPLSALKRPLFPFFVIAAMSLTLSLGVSTGAWALYRMAFAAGTVLPSHLQLHAHVQILGFAGLFIFGVALQALPRVLGAPLPDRTTVLTVLCGVGGGALLRAIGQPLTPWAAGRFLSLLSGILELSGVLAFAAWALPVLLVRRTRQDPFSLHVLAGTVWAVLAAVLSAAQSLRLAGHPEPELPPSFVEPFYFVALYGFVLSYVFGFASRMVPAFLRLTAPSRRSAAVVASLQAAGVLLALAAFFPGLETGVTRRLGLFAAVLVGMAALIFLASSGILNPRGWRLADLPIRSAFLALGLFAAFFGGSAVAELAGRTVHKFVWDGARHLFTIGFLTLLIVAMSLRVVPAFSGKVLARPRRARVAVALVGIGAFVRALQIPVAFGWGGVELYRVVGTAGLFVAAGVVLWGQVLISTLRHARTG